MHRPNTTAGASRHPVRRLLGWLGCAALCSILAALAIAYSQIWAAWLGAAAALCCYREALLIALWDNDRKGPRR